MQLFKSRDFGDLFNDTFTFLKEYGSHYIKNYILINGVLLFLTLLAYLPLLNIFFEIPSFDLKLTEPPEAFVKENITLVLATLSIGLIVNFFVGIIMYSFTPIYFKLLKKNNTINFSSTDIINALKSHYLKALKFNLGILILAIPLLIVASIAILITACTIVGMFIPIALLTMLLSFTMHEYYFKTDNRFFDSFGYAWKISIHKFWHGVGCVAVILLLGGIAQQFLSFFIDLLLDIQTSPSIVNGRIDYNIEFIAAILISSFFSIIVQFFISIITNINLAIVFYSFKGEIENLNTDSIINQIGEIE